ncbi:hypothetical protein CP532_2467 [Ophiocordyceps camponoti-leonardi (nom. inval.)]|nr:hypothetical protein CP532_2467 [Ophiocordyceps camponoti-leonardi (nom. inval.)]
MRLLSLVFSLVIFFLAAVVSAESTVTTTAQAPPTPAYVPVVTPAPDQDAALARQGYRQETFYSCNTIGTSTHCGWHVPIVRAAAATSTGSGCGGVVAVVIGFAAGFALAVT